MANTIPVPNIPTISAQEIHTNNLRAFRIGNQARYELNQGLRMLHASGLVKDLEYSSITEYAEVHFGFGRSQTMESIRVAEALDSLPLSTRRFQSGAIHWSAIRAITRVAKPETEERWLDFAKGKTTVQIEDEVQDTLKTGRDLPRKGHQGLSQFHALKTMGLLIVRKNEDGNLAFERKSDQLTASILSEAEKVLSAMPRIVAAVSTRVDGGNGSSNAVSEEQARRALRTLGRIGLREETARSRLEAAIKAFQESGKAPSDHDLVQEALLKMEDESK